MTHKNIHIGASHVAEWLKLHFGDPGSQVGIDLGDTSGHIQIFYDHLKRLAIKLNHQIEKNKMLF